MTRFLQLLTVTMFGMGCGNTEFEQRTELLRYRILGIQADKPEVAPDDVVTLSAIEYIPTESGPVSYRWSVCFISFGARAAYECVSLPIGGGEPQPVEVVYVSENPTLTIDLGPGGVVSDLLSDFGLGDQAAMLGYREFFAEVSSQERISGVDGTPLSLSHGLPVFIRLRAEHEGTVMEAVKQVIVRDGPGLNQNPVVKELAVAGELKANAKIELKLVVGEGSVETYSVPAQCPPTAQCEQVMDSEELIYSWYANGGELDRARTFAGNTQNTLTLPEEPGPVEIIVTVRDGRGGIDQARTTITVPPIR